MASESGWNLWVWLLGVVVRRYIDFLILLIPIYSSCICSFLQQHPYILFIIFNVFRFCCYYNVLPEALFCCLLVNNIVYHSFI